MNVLTNSVAHQGYSRKTLVVHNDLESFFIPGMVCCCCFGGGGGEAAKDNSKFGK